MRSYVAFALIAVVVASVAMSPFFVRWRRQMQFDAARELVEQRGGSLSFDLVDGNYILDLHGAAATDATIDAILPSLQELPTGFTLLGPGESRLFYITLLESPISDNGFESLCSLPVSCLSLDCPKLTDASAERLFRLDPQCVIITGDVPFSQAAIRRLHDAKPNMMLIVASTQDGG